MFRHLFGNLIATRGWSRSFSPNARLTRRAPRWPRSSYRKSNSLRSKRFDDLDQLGGRLPASGTVTSRGPGYARLLHHPPGLHSGHRPPANGRAERW